MRSKILILSDIHLGCSPPTSIQDREAKLFSLFDSLKSEISHLILLGDIFEFWMEYRDYIPKVHFPFLCKLQELRASGVEIHYFAGNHDFNLGQFFEKALDLEVHMEEKVLELQEQRILFYHGDGYAPSDWKYRIAKKVIRHRFSNFLFKLIHPDWGMALARFVGGENRDDSHYLDCPVNEYKIAADQKMLEHKVDAVVHGHTHLDTIEKRKAGIYVNSGQWLFKLIYTVLENGEFKQHEWES